MIFTSKQLAIALNRKTLGQHGSLYAGTGQYTQLLPHELVEDLPDKQHWEKITISKKLLFGRLWQYGTLTENTHDSERQLYASLYVQGPAKPENVSTPSCCRECQQTGNRVET